MSAYKEDHSEMFEKRRIPRFPVQLPAQLGSEQDMSSICTDLSSQGVSVETAIELNLGQKILVTVTISPHEPALKMNGQVMWKHETATLDSDQKPITEVGIRFIKTPNSPWKTPSESGLEENDEFEDSTFRKEVPHGRR